MSEHTTPTGPDDAADWFSLSELTTRLAALAWVEQNLADLLAHWSSTTTADAAACVAFARTAGHHAWHATLIRDVLATSPQLNAEEHVIAPTQGWARAIEQLRALDETEARLSALVKLIEPWLTREVGALRDLSNPLSDRDHDRVLGFVSLDHATDHDEIGDLLAQYQQVTVQLDGRRDLAEIDLR